MGNQRPDLLAATERELWKTLLEINLGSTALTELGKFLDKFDELKQQYDGRDHALDWFSHSSKFFF
jgi:hypothetical protein